MTNISDERKHDLTREGTDPSLHKDDAEVAPPDEDEETSD